VSDPIRSERRGPVTLLTLSRPDVLNALDGATLESLGAHSAAVAADAETRALVITGEGRAFCAGADIEAMRAFGPLEAEAFSALGHRVMAALEDLPIPVLAAVNGFALGGGCELALACDFIYASERARFGQPEVKLGLIPGFGGTSRLARRVGVAWAKELVMMGEPIPAQTAREIGLANRLFAPEALLDETLAAATALAARGPVAVRLAKHVLQEGQGADVRVAHALERSGFATVFGTRDKEEGIDAFLAKRDPKFEGR
jgi:enoyl-CoA hydratase